MASRVTKLLLQNCLKASTTYTKKNDQNKKITKHGSMKVQKNALSSSKIAIRRRKNKDKHPRFLEAAQAEQKQSDKTRTNLRALKTRTSAKSQRLMAKALAKRQALRL